MECNSYKVTVPGSLMLFGEHAVLHKKQAVVAAIAYYIKVKLTPRADNKIKIVSSLFNSHEVSLQQFKITQPYDYVLTAIKLHLTKITTGFTLQIESEFPSNIGFGSSAAVTVATLSVLNWWLTRNQPKALQLYRQAIRVVRTVQGFGSGADVAASIFGGIIAYKMDPITIKKLHHAPPLVAIYSGSKLATAKVVAKVEHTRKKFPTLFKQLYTAIDYNAKEAIRAINKKQWSRLGKIMNIHQGLHDALGVNNYILDQLVFALRRLPHIYGAKISGSGLGDCVIGLGKTKHSFPTNLVKNYSVNLVNEKIINKNIIDITVSSCGISYL